MRNLIAGFLLGTVVSVGAQIAVTERTAEEAKTYIKSFTYEAGESFSFPTSKASSYTKVVPEGMKAILTTEVNLVQQ